MISLPRLPWQVWAPAGVVILTLVGVWWHSGKVEDARAAAYEAGREASDEAWQVSFDNMRRTAEQWRHDAETAQERATEEEELRHEAENRAVAAAADAVRLRDGPGAAEARACPGPNSGAPVPEGTRPVPRPAPRAPDAPGTGVPSGNRQASVPWDWLTGRAEQCDLYRAEVNTWRNWYREQYRLNEEMRRQ